jgi:uncharacterized protein YgiM (DUF1202 family)
MMRLGKAAAIVIGAMLVPVAVAAEDGPDRWDVTGVASNDTLNLRSQPSPSAKILSRIPHTANGLQNFGCRGGSTLAQSQRMSAGERAAAANRRWCQISYNGKKGWVAGRFLKESAQ